MWFRKKKKRKSAAVTLRVSQKLYTRTDIMGSAFAKILTPNCFTAWFLPSLIPHRSRCRFRDFECKDIFGAVKASTHHIQQARDTGAARFLPLATLTRSQTRTQAHAHSQMHPADTQPLLIPRHHGCLSPQGPRHLICMYRRILMLLCSGVSVKQSKMYFHDLKQKLTSHKRDDEHSWAI